MVRDDSAVSETLGYILIFGIALTAIGIILMVGNGIIDNEKSKDNFQNMVQSFSIVQGDMKQVALDGAPAKTTMLHMDGGSLAIKTAAANLEVVDNNPIGGGTFYDNNTGQITFTEEKDMMNTVSFENGGVWKEESDYSYLISQPRMYIVPETKTLVINVYRLKSTSGPSAIAGSGTMTIRASYDKSSVLPAHDVGDPTAGVTLLIDTKYKEAWKTYLDNAIVGAPTGVNADVHIDTYPNGVEAKYTGISRVIISEHWVDVAFSGLYN